jgi:hypothetical protein
MDNCYFEAEYGHIMHNAELKVRDALSLLCLVHALSLLFVQCLLGETCEC